MSQEQILPINGVQLWTAIQGTGQPMVLVIRVRVTL